MDLRSRVSTSLTQDQTYVEGLASQTMWVPPLALHRQDEEVGGLRHSIEKSRWERESCPLSGIEKRPPFGGYVSIKVTLDTIRNTTVVRCREAVLFSEGPLSEARLYII